MLHRCYARAFVERWKWFADFPFDLGFLKYCLLDPTASIYTNDFDAPRVALLSCEASPFCFVDGDLFWAEAVVGAVAELRTHRATPSILIVSAATSEWSSFLAKLPPCWTIPRIEFDFQRSRFCKHPAPIGYDIQPLTTELIPQLIEVDPDFDSRQFERMCGFGFVAIHQHDVVSCAWAPAVSGWGEIAIATVAKHRGRGLAKAVAGCLIEESFSRQIAPHFTTDQRNVAARAVAASMGFIEGPLHPWVVLQCLAPIEPRTIQS